MNDHPFTRTSVIITALVAGLVFLLGIVGIVAFVPDAGPRVSSVLTITVPVFLTSLLTLAVSVRNGRIAAQAKAKAEQTHETVKTVQQQTNGINSALLNAVVGSGKVPTTSEIQVIAQKISESVAQTSTEGK